MLNFHNRPRGPLTRFLVLLVLTAFVAGCSSGGPIDGKKSLVAKGGKAWFKGNTHMHTLWSDGDAAPELAVAWYKEHDYDFLSVTDHNVMMHGERMFPIAEDSRLTLERLDELKTKFGAENVEVRDGAEGGQEMRLHTYAELKEQFEEPDSFLLIEGEEITGKAHVNGINMHELIKRSEAEDNIASMREQVGAVHEQRDRLNALMFAHIDHPNWGDAISAEDILAVPEGRYMEIYNGHGGVRNWGSDNLRIPSMDRKWDIILAHRLAADPTAMLYGVATDDTHTYFVSGAGHQIPGRGWCVVLADGLDESSIVQAFLDGDFYASSGVTLEEIRWDRRKFRVEPEVEEGVTYTTQFVGTRRGFDTTSTPALDDEGNSLENRTRLYSDAIGEVLYETTDVPAVYRFEGDEIYVRAKIISTKLQDQPFKEGDVEQAWTQPVVLKDKSKK